MTSLFVLFCMASPPAVDRFEVVRTDGTTTLMNPSFSLPEGDWLSLYHHARPRPDWPGKPHVILADGDRLAGSLNSGDDRTLKIATRTGEVSVAIASADVLWIAAPPTDGPTFPEQYPWLKTPRTRDVVLLANGDTLTGDIETFSDLGNLKIIIEGKSQNLPKDRIHAIAFNPALRVKRSPPATWYRVTLTDGSRLRATQLEHADANLKLTVLSKVVLTVPLREICSIDRRTDRMQSLSGLPTKTVELTPFLGTTWPWQANRSAKLQPLRIQTIAGVETFSEGLGLHAKTSLTYDLAGHYDRLDTLMGLDALTGRRGSAVVRIAVDGKTVQDVNLTPVASPRIRVDLNKANLLAIHLDFGTAGDVQGDVNLVDAMLWKNKAMK